MALTKEQWFLKLKALVPSWVFQKDGNNIAIWKGMAAILEQVQIDQENHFKETFILESSEEYLAEHGEERSKFQYPLEPLETFRERVRLIRNQSNIPDLKALVDALLIVPESVFINNYERTNFLNRGAYLNRNIIDFKFLYNAFTIIVKYQVREPESFYDREYFAGRGNFLGSYTSSSSVLNNIIKTVNEEKAYGTVYRLIERKPS